MSVLVQVATLWSTGSAIDSLEGLLDCEDETQTMTPARIRKARIWTVVQVAPSPPTACAALLQAG